jgi:hypothetical protein
MSGMIGAGRIKWLAQSTIYRDSIDLLALIDSGGSEWDVMEPTQIMFRRRDRREAVDAGRWPMKPYLLFLGDIYYPSGGAFDYVSDHDSLDAAKIAAGLDREEGSLRWCHIAERDTMKVVACFKRGEWE